ncbi:MAG: hypothetical protein IAF38_16800 [Bacteroidia bacterium]|nr:hypothetical protein [Bacteroidia bacterium]
MKKIIFAALFFPLLFTGQIKNMDVPFAEYPYDNSSCSGFKHPTGSLVFIPSDAFVMEDGSNCKGKIVIKYRELHTRIDMLASGINMILYREGKRKMLESVGMFEISATCSGKPMKLANGKFIQVRMKCLRNADNLQAFFYEKDKGYWTDEATAVTDFSYKKNDNNADNFKLWGNSSVGNTAIQNIELEGNDSAYMKMVNTMMGSLPEGFIKGMNVKTMGIHNYDFVIKDEKAIPIIAKFKLKTGEDITEVVRVAYTKKNTLIQYSPDDMAERFVLLPEKGIRIFVYYEDGSVAIMNQEELDKLNLSNLRGKEHTFLLEKLPAKPKDRAALAEATRIK